jgi:hypothetical protein
MAQRRAVACAVGAFNDQILSAEGKTSEVFAYCLRLSKFLTRLAVAVEFNQLTLEPMTLYQGLSDSLNP